MGEKKYDLLTLGEILLRLSPSDGGRLMRASSLDIHVGGAELNVAAGAAQLGLKTGIISRIPESEIGFSRTVLTRSSSAMYSFRW